MTNGARGILAVLAEPALRDELDRVAAAVGVRVVHAGSALPVSRKTWSAAAAIVLDEAAAQGCAHTGLSRRSHVIVLTGSEPASAALREADIELQRTRFGQNGQLHCRWPNG